jgi:hypothetical protein
MVANCMVAGSTGPVLIDLASTIDLSTLLSPPPVSFISIIVIVLILESLCNGTYSKATQAPGQPFMSIEHAINLRYRVRHQRQVRDGALGLCIQSEFPQWEIQGTTSTKIRKKELKVCRIPISVSSSRLILLNSTPTKPRDRNNYFIATSSGATVPLLLMTTSTLFWSCAAIP